VLSTGKCIGFLWDGHQSLENMTGVVTRNG